MGVQFASRAATTAAASAIWPSMRKSTFATESQAL
jgi:hypothetical protein